MDVFSESRIEALSHVLLASLDGAKGQQERQWALNEERVGDQERRLFVARLLKKRNAPLCCYVET